MTQLTRDQIDQAEAAGIVSPKQARAIRADLDECESQPKTEADAKIEAVIGDEDELRFLRSFGDVFVGIGLVLLAIGVAAIVTLLGGGTLFLLAAAGAWAMAEWFGRKKRAHFPTLITALAFLIFVQMGLQSVASLSGILAAMIAVAAMSLFYWRIHLPFCIALIASSLLYLLFATLSQLAPGLLRDQFEIVMIGSGLIVFAVALLYDVQDTHRRTRFSDNAFWLHLLAAPLIIHGLGWAAVGEPPKTEFLFDIVPALQSGAIIVLVSLGIITLVGLAINRRALIVSSLLYAGAAIALLVGETGLDFGRTLSLTLILLGAFIVLLGVAWHPARNQLIRLLPKWRVFPPPYEPEPTAQQA